MEPKTKKGLIIGGSIAAVVLLGTTIGLGVYLGRTDASNDAVQVWGYDDQVSSTAKKVNWYMGTDTELVPGSYGGVAVSSEKVLLDNDAYHSMEDDIFILDGVAGSKNGLGYLSSAWVASYDAEEMRMLSLWDGTQFLNPEEEITNPGHTYDEIENADGDQTYTAEDVNGVDIPEIAVTDTAKGTAIDTSLVTAAAVDAGAFIASTDGIVYNLDGNETDGYTVGSAITKYTEGMNATLNIHMKLPKAAADYFRPLISATPAATGTADADAQAYIDWLAAEEYADDLMLAIALFDFIAYDSSNIESINTMLIPGTSTTGSGEFEADDWAVLDTEYQKIMGSTDSLTDALVAQQNTQGGTFAIQIDGTGTNSGIAKAEISNFESEFEAISGAQLNFVYDLDNGGSGEGWKLPTTEIPGTTGSLASSNARPDSFLGTQSRFSKDSEYIAWGYTDYTGADAATGMYADPSASTDVIGYTMGIDLPVFFVQEEMELTFTPSEDFVTNHGDMVLTGEVLEAGTSYTVKPTGMTPEGGKSIFQNGASWQEVMDAGLVQFEVI